MHEFVRQPRLVTFGDDDDGEDDDYDVYLFWPSRSNSTVSEEHMSYESREPLLDDRILSSPDSPLSLSSCETDSSEVLLFLLQGALYGDSQPLHQTSGGESLSLHFDEHHDDIPGESELMPDSAFRTPHLRGLPALELDLQELPDLSPLPSPAYSFDSSFAFPVDDPPGRDIMDHGYSNLFCMGLFAESGHICERFSRLRQILRSSLRATKSLFTCRVESQPSY